MMTILDMAISEAKETGKTSNMKFKVRLIEMGMQEKEANSINIEKELVRNGFKERTPGNWRYESAQSQVKIRPATTIDSSSDMNLMNGPKKVQPVENVLKKSLNKPKLENSVIRNEQNTEFREEDVDFKYQISVNDVDKFYTRQTKNNFSNASHWMTFFVELGKYMASNRNRNVFVSFLDSVLPAAMISFGIAKKFMDFAASEEGSARFFEKLESLSAGDELMVKANGIWQRGKLVSSDEKSITVQVLDSDRSELQNTFLNSAAAKKVRFNSSKGNGKRKFVNLDDDISGNLKYLYLDSELNKIKALNETPINLVGTRISTEFRELIDHFYFVGVTGGGNRIYRFKDFIYEDTDKQNFRNLNWVKSAKDTDNPGEGISIFIGASNTMNMFYQFRGIGNIFIDDRTRSQPQRDEFIQWLQDVAMLDKKNVTDDFVEYLGESRTLIPKGVEVYVWAD